MAGSCAEEVVPDVSNDVRRVKAWESLTFSQSEQYGQRPQETYRDPLQSISCRPPGAHKATSSLGGIPVRGY